MMKMWLLIQKFYFQMYKKLIFKDSMLHNMLENHL